MNTILNIIVMDPFLYINLLLIFSGSVNSVDQRIDPLVQIEQGLVKGLLGLDGLYGYFLGIPYAEVDVENPFGDAEPPPNFDATIFEATTHVMCPQRVDPMKKTNESPEDSPNITLNCLTLNIYIPDEASTSNLLPVLIWIHGDQFLYGSGASNNPEYFMDKGILIVTVNYRLGPYGFLCLDSHTVPGNQGLKDQYLAFQWVRNNITPFGGDPEKITIGGHGAGATSALLHLYADKEKIFKHVIAQSGTPMSVEHFYQADLDAAMKLAEFLGFNVSNTDSALKDLANVPHTDVTEAFFQLGLKVGPCKERSFSGIKNYIFSYPFFLSNEENVRDTPVLIGHTSNEEKGASYFTDEYFDEDPFYRRLNDNFDFKNHQLLAEASEYVRIFYIADQDVSINISSKFEEFESDFKINYPVQKIITNLLNENASQIYNYVFGYTDNAAAETARYSDELKFLFKTSSNSNDPDDKLMVDRMTTLWANFVKYGNPSPEPTELLPVTWHFITTKQRPYLDLNKEMILKNRIYHDRMVFWDLFYKINEKYHRLAKECIFESHFNKVKTTPT